MKFRIAAVVCTVVGIAGCGMDWRPSQTGSDAPEQGPLLEEIDTIYTGLYPFLADLYDPESGGFYESTARLTPPRIESTARGLTILERGGVLDDLPDSMRLGFIRFFQRFQDPRTGFFEDIHEDRDVHQRRGRALGYTLGALEKLGGEPLYPLPGSEPETEGMEHLASVEAFGKWLESLPWEHSWRAGSILTAQNVLIERLPEERRRAVLAYLFDYLARRQNQKTGMWGGGEPYVLVSGAFKLSGIYGHFGRPMPQPERIYHTLLGTMRHEEAKDATWVRNPLYLFQAIEPYITIPAAERHEIMRIAVKNIARFRRPDGGFARHVDYPYGETDGCSQAMKTRDAILEMAGIEPPPFPNGPAFFDTLRRRDARLAVTP